MNANDTRYRRAESRQTDLRTFGLVTADQLRFGEYERDQEDDRDE